MRPKKSHCVSAATLPSTDFLGIAFLFCEYIRSWRELDSRDILSHCTARTDIQLLYPSRSGIPRPADLREYSVIVKYMLRVRASVSLSLINRGSPGLLGGSEQIPSPVVWNKAYRPISYHCAEYSFHSRYQKPLIVITRHIILNETFKMPNKELQGYLHESARPKFWIWLPF